MENQKFIKYTKLTQLAIMDTNSAFSRFNILQFIWKYISSSDRTSFKWPEEW